MNLFSRLMWVALMMATPLSSPMAQDLSPAVTKDGYTTQVARADQAFPLLKGFLALPAADRDQVSLGYILKVKKASPQSVTLEMIDQGRTTAMTIGADGKVTPLPTLEQLRRGAQVSIKGPQNASVALKLKLYSTQGLKTSYDANGLARGITQGNNAAKKIAGVLAAAVPKLDRVYLVGGSNAVVTLKDGSRQPLPVTAQAGEYPAGTPYFVPSKWPSFTTITLTKAPRVVMFDTPPKK